MKLALTLAWRDLRAGGRGLWLLAVCLFLGTAALSGIGSLTASILASLDTQGRMALGGDLELRVSQRRATIAEAATMARRGPVSETISLRAMVEHGDAAPVLVDLKAIDDRWPMVGRLEGETGSPSHRPHGAEVVIAPVLVSRLGIHIGDDVRIGFTTLKVAGLLGTEPDQRGEGFRIGPVVLIDMAGLDATQLLQPGSLYTSRYRLLLRPAADAKAIGQALIHAFGDAGWSLRTPSEATGGLRRTIDELGQFLLLIGLSAMTIAGVGIGSGVSAYLDGKTRMIAMLKVMGARSNFIAALFLWELGGIALLAILVGLGFGAAVPALVHGVAGNALPVPLILGIYPEPLLVAAMLDAIVALMFAIPALARSRSIPAASLLRDVLADRRAISFAPLAGVVLLALAIITIAVLTASDRILALGFSGAMTAFLLGLAGTGVLVRRLLAAIPHPRRPLLRLALTNLHRPGAQTARLVVALGLGFSLFVALAVIDTSLTSEMRDVAPAKAPRFFAIDLQPEDASTFRGAVERAAPGARIETTPSLRGSIVAIRGQRIADIRPPPDSWVLRGDRTITWSANLPPRNRIVAGHWWAADYHGDPLVSLGSNEARALGLRVGDEITISVLGVDVSARIAALRQIDWSAMGLNFAIIFSPGYIEEAPHGLMASVSAGPDHDGQIARAVAEALPSVTMVRVADIIGQIGDLLARIVLAIRSAASVTVAAGLAVLVGTVAASSAARRKDAVVLKLLGARRLQILGVQALEYGLLAALLSAVALVLGAGAGWFVVVHVLKLAFAPDWSVVLLTVGATSAVTVGVGIAGGLPILAARAAEGLRAA